jgi:hypothetical protein
MITSSAHSRLGNVSFGFKDGFQLTNRMGAVSISPFHGSGSWKSSNATRWAATTFDHGCGTTVVS